jgi:hypothetical protein
VSPWKSVHLIAVDNFVLSILLDVLPDVFTSETQNAARMIVVTDTIRVMASQAMRQFVRMNPIFLPSVEPLGHRWTSRRRYR